MVEAQNVTAWDDDNLYRVEVTHAHGNNIVNVEVKRRLFNIPVVDKSVLDPRPVYSDSDVVVGEGKAAIHDAIEDAHARVGSGDILTDDDGDILVSAS